MKIMTWLAFLFVTATAQEPPRKIGDARKTEELSIAPTKVDVKPIARDEEIRERLQSVLEATDWFTSPQVRVEEGVVFLKGRVESDELKNRRAIWRATLRTSSPSPTGWWFPNPRCGIGADIARIDGTLA